MALATSIGLKTVAEGVENEEQYRILQQLGCDSCQGFYFSKPLPLSEFQNKYFEETIVQ